jgi:hypothetical protein
LSWESQTEGVQRWHPGGVWTHNTPGPMHRSCALYATVGVCPYLRHSNTRGKVSAGRGEAAVFGFARHGLAFFDGPLGLADPESSSLDHIFGYAEERQRIDFDTYRRHIALYEQALAEDEWIDTRTRLYSQTPSQEINHLRHCKLADDQLVASMRRTAVYRAHTGHVYRLALLQ